MEFDYTKTLPQGTKKCISMKDFARIKKGKRVWKKGNTEPYCGRVYYVYSITHKVYWRRVVSQYTDWDKVKQYVKDGTVYINKYPVGCPIFTHRLINIKKTTRISLRQIQTK